MAIEILHNFQVGDVVRLCVPAGSRIDDQGSWGILDGMFFEGERTISEIHKRHVNFVEDDMYNYHHSFIELAKREGEHRFFVEYMLDLTYPIFEWNVYAKDKSHALLLAEKKMIERGINCKSINIKEVLVN